MMMEGQRDPMGFVWIKTELIQLHFFLYFSLEYVSCGSPEIDLNGR